VTEFIQQAALVSETAAISESELTRASAALQKQLTRDFGPIWDVRATIDTFARLEDVPLAYWPILIQDDIHVDAAGVHLDNDGQPFALVQYSNHWTLTASHELLEMSADPFGNRLIASRSVKRGQGRVQYLVEVADPSEAAEFGYHVNGILVSDFYTPHFFDPVTTTGTRYSFTGAIKKPRQVLRGGYLSWHHPPSDHWWQQRWFSGDKPVFKDLGALKGSQLSIRAQIDRLTPMREMVEDLPPRSKVLTESKSVREEVDQSTTARARTLRTQIEEIKTDARG
jgi:hypothetical protein